MSHTARRVPVHVRIEELRLEGFDPHRRYRIAEAIQRELTRLLATRSDVAPLGPTRSVARLDAGSFSFRKDDSAQRIGAAIARATYRGLTGSGRER